MPAIPPAIPPNPTTEATARPGNVSETSVNKFTDHPWCAAAARLSSPTAGHRVLTYSIDMMGNAAMAQRTIAVLRDALGDQPCTASPLKIQPPPIEPMSAAR